ncbi:excinuclease ABC subunit UvrA [Pedobacter miscanthi]|uniref:excinuclease ABC subunit UvrA n=1 Tax=Pedobacter miscanthi TaxID=2259170 RepID=UPI00292F6876|nr:excinuclease ABC subunit UvrA [Pedobacter miscanthi]
MQKNKDMIRVRGAREHNLKDIDIDIPRDKLVVFTGVSGSGKSSLAFGTLYAEAQRRYLESVSPYARRLFNQMGVPEVESIEGLPPAIALQQQRGGTSTRSSVGSVTTLSNLLRMLYSRAGEYPRGQPIIYAEGFSPNTPQGACPECHGLGSVFEVTEKTMVPDDSLSIRERAVASWPLAWQGQNQRDILVSMGFNVDIPWKELPRDQRDWILFTNETPTVPVYPGYSPEETAKAIKNKKTPDYMGTFIGAKPYVMKTFSSTQSELMKKRVSRFMVSSKCPECNGKRLRKESLSIRFDGKDFAEISRLPISHLCDVFKKFAQAKGIESEKQIVTQRISRDILSRMEVMLELGLGYLSLERTTPTLSPGELQRLRLATQVHSNLFGVVYVLDEPSAGLHPADTQALLRILDRLKEAGNSIFVIEHEIEVIRHADWIVEVGPEAGEKGGYILYSGLPEGLKKIKGSPTSAYLFGKAGKNIHSARKPTGQLILTGISRHNLNNINVEFPIGVMTCVTGISGSGKSSLVSQVLVELISDALGQKTEAIQDLPLEMPQEQTGLPLSGRICSGLDQISRLVVVDQKPIGRTPRSNLSTYTGLFDHVRKRFADTPLAKKRKYDAGRFSFNVAKGRCPNCQGEGFVMVELLFLPSVYTPCPVCNGSRYNPQTLEITYKEHNIAQVLEMTVEQACNFFDEDSVIYRALDIVREVGLGYLRLGQSATELSGGEAQRIKLATELQKSQKGSSLYILDEPTTGLHPSDVERLLLQLNKLADAGNTVIVVEHDMQVIAQSDWVIDIGPGAGECGGKILYSGNVDGLLKCNESKTAPFLERYLNDEKA